MDVILEKNKNKRQLRTKGQFDSKKPTINQKNGSKQKGNHNPIKWFETKRQPRPKKNLQQL
jgi:hypothetical protein